jgi:hypothetical protein
MVISETISDRRPGVGGLPQWTKTTVMTLSRADMTLLETNAVPQDRLKLVVLPGRRELAALRTDGQALTLVTFTPTDYDFGVIEGVLIGPAQVRVIGPKQPSGTYINFAIVACTQTIQQTKANDW